MVKPFFTIITPTLNSGKYLEECIKSVELQSFRDWEHIFIDSYSADKTLSILKAYKKRHPKKVRIYQYPKRGISNAFNKGIDHARGEYLNFLGSDDLLEKDTLSIVHKNMGDGKHSWCYGNFRVINRFGKILGVKEYFFNKFNYFLLFFGFYLHHQTVFMQKKLFSIYGQFDEKYKFAMDYDLFLRISKRYEPIYIRENLCRFRFGSGESSINWILHNTEMMNIALKHSSFIFHPFVYTFFYLNYLVRMVKNLLR